VRGFLKIRRKSWKVLYKILLTLETSIGSKALWERMEKGGVPAPAAGAIMVKNRQVGLTILKRRNTNTPPKIALMCSFVNQGL